MTPKKMKRMLWCCLLIIVFGVIAGLYLSNATLSSLANKTAKLRTESEVNQQKLSTYKTSRQRVEELDYINDLAQQILPAGYSQSSTIAELSQFALRSNLQVADITFDIPTEEDKKAARKEKKDSKDASKKLPKGITVVPLTLTLQEGARYADVLDFLTTIEQNRRKMQVVTVNLTPSEGDGAVLDQVVLRISVYTRQDAKAPAAEVSP